MDTSIHHIGGRRNLYRVPTNRHTYMLPWSCVPRLVGLRLVRDGK